MWFQKLCPHVQTQVLQATKTAILTPSTDSRSRKKSFNSVSLQMREPKATHPHSRDKPTKQVKRGRKEEGSFSDNLFVFSPFFNDSEEEWMEVAGAEGIWGCLHSPDPLKGPRLLETPNRRLLGLHPCPLQPAQVGSVSFPGLTHSKQARFFWFVSSCFCQSLLCLLGPSHYTQPCSRHVLNMHLQSRQKTSTNLIRGQRPPDM